jgi:hypothetical protein
MEYLANDRLVSVLQDMFQYLDKFKAEHSFAEIADHDSFFTTYMQSDKANNYDKQSLVREISKFSNEFGYEANLRKSKNHEHTKQVVFTYVLFTTFVTVCGVGFAYQMLSPILGTMFESLSKKDDGARKSQNAMNPPNTSSSPNSKKAKALPVSMIAHIILRTIAYVCIPTLLCLSLLNDWRSYKQDAYPRIAYDATVVMELRSLTSDTCPVIADQDEEMEQCVTESFQQVLNDAVSGDKSAQSIREISLEGENTCIFGYRTLDPTLAKDRRLAARMADVFYRKIKHNPYLLSKHAAVDSLSKMAHAVLKLKMMMDLQSNIPDASQTWSQDMRDEVKRELFPILSSDFLISARIRIPDSIQHNPETTKKEACFENCMKDPACVAAKQEGDICYTYAKPIDRVTVTKEDNPCLTFMKRGNNKQDTRITHTGALDLSKVEPCSDDAQTCPITIDNQKFRVKSEAYENYMDLFEDHAKDLSVIKYDTTVERQIKTLPEDQIIRQLEMMKDVVRQKVLELHKLFHLYGDLDFEVLLDELAGTYGSRWPGVKPAVEKLLNESVEHAEIKMKNSMQANTAKHKYITFGVFREKLRTMNTDSYLQTIYKPIAEIQSTASHLHGQRMPKEKNDMNTSFYGRISMRLFIFLSLVICFSVIDFLMGQATGYFSMSGTERNRQDLIFRVFLCVLYASVALFIISLLWSFHEKDKHVREYNRAIMEKNGNNLEQYSTELYDYLRQPEALEIANISSCASDETMNNPEALYEQCDSFYVKPLQLDHVKADGFERILYKNIIGIIEAHEKSNTTNLLISKQMAFPTLEFIVIIVLIGLIIGVLAFLFAVLQPFECIRVIATGQSLPCDVISQMSSTVWIICTILVLASAVYFSYRLYAYPDDFKKGILRSRYFEDNETI